MQFRRAMQERVEVVQEWSPWLTVAVIRHESENPR
jgi:hypothetical protein